jgi:hypothetical protein
VVGYVRVLRGTHPCRRDVEESEELSGPGTMATPSPLKSHSVRLLYAASRLRKRCIFSRGRRDCDRNTLYGT